MTHVHLQLMVTALRHLYSLLQVIQIQPEVDRRFSQSSESSFFHQVIGLGTSISLFLGCHGIRCALLFPHLMRIRAQFVAF